MSVGVPMSLPRRNDLLRAAQKEEKTIRWIFGRGNFTHLNHGTNTAPQTPIFQKVLNQLLDHTTAHSISSSGKEKPRNVKWRRRDDDGDVDDETVGNEEMEGR